MRQGLLSLRWRLIWSLILLQVVVGVLVMGGFLGLAWVLGRVVDETGQETIKAIQRALVLAPDGKLAIEPTPEVQRLREADPPFWFIARDSRGSELRNGEVPPVYARLFDSLDGMERMAIDPRATTRAPRPASSGWRRARAPWP